MTVPASSPSCLAVCPVGELGGGEVLLVELLEQLRMRGWRVRLAVFGAGPLTAHAPDRRIETVALGAFRVSRPAQLWAATRHLRAALGDPGPDVVLANHPKGQLVAWLADSRAARRRLVGFLHDPPHRRDGIAAVARRLPAAARVANGDVTAAAHARQGTPPPVVVPPGVPTARIRALAEEGDAGAVLARAGLDADRPLLLTVGRLQPHKGAARAIPVAAALPDVNLLIVGADSPRAPGHREELEREIDRRGLRRRVALIADLSPADLAATMRRAAILVHPASSEQFGLVLVEAMCLGTPVVASAASGPALVLARGGGVLVPVGRDDLLVAAVRDLLADDDRYRRLAGEAPGAAARFDSSVAGEALDGVLRALVGRLGAPSPTA